MEFILLTKTSVPVIGQIADLLGIIMDALFRFTSQFGIVNIGLSIILFTVLINIFLWPLTVQQQKSSKLMSVMQPELMAIQNKYKNRTDQASMMRMQAETKAVYSKYGTSMSGSCIMLLIQMPILFALYQVIYKIPAYVPSVYRVFQKAAEPVMQQSGYVSVLNEIGSKIKPALEDPSTLNQVIDFLYKFTPTQWSDLASSFPSLADTINSAADEIYKMNYFLGINLATPPFQGFMPNAAWLIPILAALVQWYSAKLMSDVSQSSKSSDSDNAMAQQMKMMNTMMPLMSLFFCFTLPSGLGVYWVASGVCRMVQQLIINRQLSKMDIDEIVRKNIEKANKKAIKDGANPSQLKTRTDKILKEVKSQESEENNEEQRLKERATKTAKQVADSTAYYNKNAKPGSLAAKANMVAMYDERMEEKRRNKRKKKTADSTADGVKNTAAAALEAKDTAEKAETAAKETAEKAETAVEETAEKAETAVQETAEKAETAVQETAEKAQTAVEETVEKTEAAEKDTAESTENETVEAAETETSAAAESNGGASDRQENGNG